MRFHTTIAFSEARKAWQDAYAAHDVIASNPDPEIADRSPAANAAGDLEYATLERLLIMPAATPTEIAEKLRIMRSRMVDESWTDDHPRYMAQIERDLIEQQRPNVSPAMATAFAAWAETNQAQHVQVTGEDAHDFALDDGHAAAFIAMVQTPCYTPGDFMVKVYANLLGEHGSTYSDRWPESAGHPFEINGSELTEGKGSCDGAAEVAFLADLLECDLGRCLMALGRVDFDAETWLAAAKRIGMPVNVVIQRDGSQGLWTAQPQGNDPAATERWHACQALIAGGLGIVGAERRKAVATAIEANHPALIFDARQAQEVAA